MTKFRIAWITDPHLNFLRPEALKSFIKDIKLQDPTDVFITGDIAEAPSLVTYLELLDDCLQIPIWFVLGNHDYYRGSIKKVREKMVEMTQGDNNLCWMPRTDYQKLSDKTAVVGVDGWCDGRLGDAEGSRVLMNDWRLIKELRDLGNFNSDPYYKDKLLPYTRELADKEAKELRPKLDLALERFEHVYVLTHVPPWKEATWHEGNHSDDDWLPWFSCKAVGAAIEGAASRYPDKDVTVLCGHTHGSGESQITDNVRAITAGANYGAPKVDRIIEVE